MGRPQGRSAGLMRRGLTGLEPGREVAPEVLLLDELDDVTLVALAEGNFADLAGVEASDHYNN